MNRAIAMIAIIIIFSIAYLMARSFGGTGVGWITAWPVIALVIGFIDAGARGHGVKVALIVAFAGAIGAIIGWFAYRGVFSILLQYLQPIIEAPHQPVDESQLTLPRHSGVWSCASFFGVAVWAMLYSFARSSSFESYGNSDSNS